MVVNNLDDAPLMLMVQRLEGESKDTFSAYMRERYDARPDDPDWGPKYKIGSTYLCGDRKFTAIQTFAGSLVMQIVFDRRNGKFERPVIFRFNPSDQFELSDADGRQFKFDYSKLISAKD